MKKVPLTIHPNFVVIPSLYFILLLLLKSFFDEIYLKRYLISSVICLPALLVHKNYLRKYIEDFVKLSIGASEEKKESLRKVKLPFILYLIEVMLHVALKLPIIWTSIAWSMILVPECCNLYKEVSERVTGQKFNNEKLKGDISRGVGTFLLILCLAILVMMQFRH